MKDKLGNEINVGDTIYMNNCVLGRVIMDLGDRLQILGNDNQIYFYIPHQLVKPFAVVCKTPQQETKKVWGITGRNGYPTDQVYTTQEKAEAVMRTLEKNYYHLVELEVAE